MNQTPAEDFGGGLVLIVIGCLFILFGYWGRWLAIRGKVPESQRQRNLFAGIGGMLLGAFALLAGFWYVIGAILNSI